MLKPFSLTILALLAQCAIGYKFLLYMPLHGRSHVNFLGKLADTLIDAGHNVTVILPIWDSTMDTKGSTRATTIEIPQLPEVKKVEEEMYREDGIIYNVWKSTNPLELIFMFMEMSKSWLNQCEAIYNQPGLMERLKTEKFDVGFAEVMDSCGVGIFHHLGIEKTAITWSIATYESSFDITGMPYTPSYVPGSMAKWGDQMTFIERFYSLFAITTVKVLLPFFMKPYDVLHKRMFGDDFPEVMDLYTKTSLVFLNYDQLIDFPRPTTHKVIDIGGITVEGGPKKLNQTWESIMSLRPKTVLLSFGTFAKAYLMPPEYKETIRETFRKFPDVTFIWKYEKPEHDIGKGVDNIVVTTWAPQNDMLYDPRLTLFITHCGQGSTTEAIVAGVPLIVIPVGGDQYRNAQVVKRNGVGILMEKEDLGREGVLEATLKELLENDRYRQSAKRISAMLAARPFSPKQTFVRNMEFLARYGPLRNLDHYGTQLNFLQYYCLDVIAVVAFVSLAILSVTFLFCRCMLRTICTSCSGKRKVE